MAKYAPLGSFLRRWKRTNTGRSVDLTFADVERIIGAILPKAANQQGWWQNETTLGRAFVHCTAWIDAGFDAFLIEKEKVQFVLKHSSMSATVGGRSAPGAAATNEREAIG